MYITRHLDLGCGDCPRNPYGCDEVHAIDLMIPADVDSARFRQANLTLEPIPHIDSSFDSISAFDFLEHIPRVLSTVDGLSTRFPFVELMGEVHRVLKPNGRFYALSPAYPSAQAFQDPTHVNFITEETCRYFCGDRPDALMYGFRGRFALSRNERALYPEAFKPTTPIGWQRKWRRRRLLARGSLSHVMWEFVCVKPALAALPK